MTTRLMRVREASRRYNLPPARIYTAITRGELPAIDIGTTRKKSLLLSEEDIAAWLASLKTGGDN